MDEYTYPVIGARYKQLSNIPRNTLNSYTQSSGHIAYSDGTFMFYGGVSIEGSDGQIIDGSKEIDANWSVTLSQIPCDSSGNILMTSSCLSPIDDDGYGPAMRIMIFCKKQPSHRIVLSTGELIENSSDNCYMREIVFSYSLLQR